MKVVLDTNVIISGLLFHGPPGKIINLWVEERIIVLFSQALLEEYLAVLLRPKFKRFGTPLERQVILTDLIELDNSVFVQPGTKLSIIKEDSDDNRVMECALEGQAECIVSGDSHLLSLQEYRGIPIMTPGAFIETYFIND